MAARCPLREPLLHQKSATKDVEDGSNLTGGEVVVSAPREGESASVVDFNYILAEAKIQILIAGPMVLVNLLQYAILVVSNIFSGHLGELELASSSLANSIASVLGFYILLGMASALETLCGRAFGAGQYHMMGIHFQRSLVVICVTCVPLTFLFLHMENVLLFVGQTADISAKAGEYAIWLIPALYAFAFLQPFTKFLQTQSVVVPMVVCSGVTLAFHVGLCWLIVYKLAMGFAGAALATSISYCLNVVILFLYVTFTGVCKETMQAGLSKEIFADLKTFSRLALSSGVMLCLEYWCFEVMVMLAGLLPNPELELSGLSVCLSTVTLNYMIPFGLSAAASTRVSNELGAGKPNAAKMAVYVSVGISMLQATVVCIALLLARNVWGWVFSNELEVVKYVAQIMPIIAYLALCDGIQGVLSGVLRGAGMQDLGAIINLCTFYGVGLPLGVVLAFHVGWGGKGIFTGLIVGLGSQMIVLAIVSFRADWVKQAEDASPTSEDHAQKGVIENGSERPSH